MKQRPRIYCSDSQKALMWERWKKGDSLQQIAQLFNRNHGLDFTRFNRHLLRSKLNCRVSHEESQIPSGIQS
jgi:hypothetical protein